MARKRKALSKRTRFEVFKRDGFRCVYCGADPSTSVLHVDHVTAVANGGDDEPSNLVTACASCNGGKSSVPLEQRKLAATMSAADLSEHLEQMREFLSLQRALSSAKRDVVEMLATEWGRRIGPMSNDMRLRMEGLIGVWPVERLLEAIEITARKLGAPTAETFYPHWATQQAKYFHGILRRWRNEG